MVRRDGFTLIELLVVLAIILLLVGIIAPAFQPVMELTRRQKCAANLNKIVKDMRTYALANENFFPSAYCDSGKFADGTVYPMVSASNAVGVDRQVDMSYPAGNVNRKAPSIAGPSRSLYLLARGTSKYTSLDAFICPSTDHATTKLADTTKDFDFVSQLQLSYSYQSHKNGGDGLYWPVTTASEGALVVLADRNPIIGEDTWDKATNTKWNTVAGGANVRGGTDKYNQNSYNHNQEGQNVIDASSSVRWTTTPNCSARLWMYTDPVTNAVAPIGDNIWTWGAVADGTPQTGANFNGAFADSCPTTSRDSILR